MTNDFKDMTMEYLTGNLTVQTSPEQVYFEQNYRKRNNFVSKLNFEFDYGYTIEGKVQGKTSTNEGAQYTIVYGKYVLFEGGNYNNSYIAVVDENYNVLDIIKRYANNNERFGKIMGINVDKDGRFYFLEKDVYGYYRFVLANNIVAKLPTQEHYQVIQRQTYRISDQTYFNNVEHVEIEKHPDSARYVMFGFRIDAADQIKCLEFVINVGGENEWNYIGEDTSYISIGNYVYDYHIYWNDQNQFKIRIIGLNESTYEGSTSIYHTEFVKYFDSDEFIWLEWFPRIMGNLDPSSITYKQSIYKNDNETYFSLHVGTKNYLYLYDYDEDTTTKFLEEEANASYIAGIRLLEKNGNIFFVYQKANPLYVGVLDGTTLYTTQANNWNAIATPSIISIQNMYNLYIIYAQIGSYINIAKIPYIDKTNNQSYTNKTSLVPYFGKLYDSDNKLLYARTLYNKYVSGQTTTSVLEVPNQYLNGITIANQKLIGKTYCELNDNHETFEKNQYEEVFVNFANTLNMINQNDEENPILNVAGATRLNQAISSTNDYENTQATKFKINYADGTSMINNFLATQIELLPNETRKYRYTWQVFNPSLNEILSIDIISEDEATTYQHITDMELVPGKMYTLTQDVYMI